MSNKKFIGRSLLALLALSLCLVAYYMCSCKRPCEGAWDDEYKCGWVCRAIGVPGTVFTGYGVIVTVLGFWFISTQIVQGQKVLSLTRKSVRGYIETERGRLYLSRIRGEKNRAHEPQIEFANIGKTAVLLEDSSFRVFQLDHRIEEDPETHPGAANNATPLAIMPDRIITNNRPGGELAFISVPQPTNDEWIQINEQVRFLYLRGWINYKSVFGTRYRLNVCAQWHPDHRNYTIGELPRYNTEDVIED